MKPICVACARFYRPKKTGVSFIEGMPKESGAAPGQSEADKWTDYKLWSGDLWQCEGCSAEIIVGTGCYPISEHYQDRFAETVEKFGPIMRVNDC